jgi:hypothetical protein
VDVHQDGHDAVATVNGTRDGIIVEFAVTLSESDGEWKVVQAE